MTPSPKSAVCVALLLQLGLELELLVERRSSGACVEEPLRQRRSRASGARPTRRRARRSAPANSSAGTTSETSPQASASVAR